MATANFHGNSKSVPENLGRGGAGRRIHRRNGAGPVGSASLLRVDLWRHSPAGSITASIPSLVHDCSHCQCCLFLWWHFLAGDIDAMGVAGAIPLLVWKRLRGAEQAKAEPPPA